MPTKATSYKRFLVLTTCCLSGIIANGCANSKFSESPGSSAASMTGPAMIAQTPAKNVILFIGDGMGVSTITAARIFDGQSLGMSGEEHSLAFESFDNLALIKTYNMNAQVPDSAGTATAILSGYKTNIGAINVKPDNLFAGCRGGAPEPTLSDIAAKAGKSIGVISTARLTHATPAAMYAHSASRDWEADKDIKDQAAEAGCESIAAQLVKPTTPINLALGGGTKEFSDAQIAMWSAQGGNHVVIKDGAAFAALTPGDTQDVLGLFGASHMDFEADRSNGDQPSLSEMTSFAIENLSARGTGYVLMVEAGRVDHAHHGTNAHRAMHDMQALNEAVKTALAKTGDDTLIMVTADHSHVFTMAGYPVRGNPILGLVRSLDRSTGQPDPNPSLAKDGKPYTTLGYHNGPNVREADSEALTDEIVADKDYRQQTAVEMWSETHAGEDVPLYADGPGAQNVRGVMEQNEIHDVMIKALGIEKK